MARPMNLKLGTLQPRAFSLLNRVETLDSACNYYLYVHMSVCVQFKVKFLLYKTVINVKSYTTQIYILVNSYHMKLIHCYISNVNSLIGDNFKRRNFTHAITI